MDSLPIEVQALILERVEVKCLLRLRFTCKAWNQEICKILQLRCAVSLYSSFREKPSTRCITVEDYVQAQAEFTMPSPVKEAQLCVVGYESLPWMESPPNISMPTITALDIQGYCDSFPRVGSILLDGLKLYSRTLKTLVLACYITYPASPEMYRDLCFPSLQSLQCGTTYAQDNLNSILAITAIIKASPNLKKLYVQGMDDEVPNYAPIFEQCSLVNVELLAMNMGSETIQGLLKAKMSRLKFLKICQAKSVLLTQIRALILKFGSTLQSLQIPDIHGKDFEDNENFPPCPRLKKLRLRDYVIGRPLLAHCPILKYLIVEFLYVEGQRVRTTSVDSVKSVFVQEVHFNPTPNLCAPGQRPLRRPPREKPVRNICLSRNLICRHFPNLQKLHYWEGWDGDGFPKFGPKEFFTYETNRFPSVPFRGLIVDLFTERDPNEGGNHLHAQAILDSPSIQPDVETLDLHHFHYQQNPFKNRNPLNLSNLPKLTEVGFHWHEDLNADDLILALERIPVVFVNGCCYACDEQVQNELDKFMTLPNVQCACRRLSYAGTVKFEADMPFSLLSGIDLPYPISRRRNSTELMAVFRSAL